MITTRTAALILACAATCLPAGPAVAAELRALIVTGLAGTDDYAERFDASAASIAGAFRSLSSDADAVRRLDAPTREQLLAAITERAGGDLSTDPSADASQNALFALVLIGHGSLDARGYKFNLPGPDADTADLVAALAQVSATRQLVVLASSASGALLEVLEQPGRLVVTATKSGGELNAVRFPVDFAAALTGTDADLDRNEILTLAEAFRYTDAAVADYFEQQNLLASEHPRLAGDGADTLALARLGALAGAADDPVVARLLGARLALETEFAQLKREKPALAPADYYTRLESLLVRIARLQLRIDDATGWSDPDADS